MRVRTAKPYLVVRASIEPGVMDEFLRWYVQVHLPHVMAIPGIERAYRSNCHRAGVNWTALYEIKDDASVNVAITSSEADRARQDWERWLPHVQDLSVEVYAALGPQPSLHHWN
jgi:hypothetical protein